MNHSNTIIFGTGPLGWWVMQTLVSQEAQITLVNRRGRMKQTLPETVTLVAADATDPSLVSQLCKEADTVFHCAMPAYTEWPEKFPPLTQGILQGVSQSGAKLVYGDNLYMYGDPEGKKITEDLPYAATGPKGKVRAEMAKQLLEAHQKGDVPVVIGRGSDFYGPQVVNSMFGDMFFRAALSGQPVNLLGNINLPHTYTYIKDFARSLVQLSQSEQSFGQAWHIPNPPTLSTQQLVHLIEQEIGQPIKIRTAGRTMVSLLGLLSPLMREMKEMMYEWEKPYVVDHSRFEQAFGADPTPHEVAIKETVAGYRQQIGINP